jgi:parallel beta-helix repeat protein
MTLKFLSVGTTNTGSATYVGRFDYMAVYPWWQAGFTSTNTVTATNLIANSNSWYAANNNTIWLQKALNDVVAQGGGTVLITNIGTNYVAQLNPNETNDASQNAIFNIGNNYIAISGTGTNVVLMGYNRVTTIIYLGIDTHNNKVQCSNFTLQKITLEAQPHMAVSTNSPTQVVYQSGMYNWTIGTAGALITLAGGSSSAYANNILFTNCQFVDADRAIDIGTTSNVLVQSCSFIQFQGTNGYVPGECNTSIPNSIPDYKYLLGIFGQGFDYNIGVVGCSYNGNPNFTNQITSNPNPTNYITNQFGAGNGLILTQNGGNFFVLRNFVTNNAEEAINFYAGPLTAAGNTFWSWGNNNSCGAFAVNLESSGATGASYPNYSATFIGNSVTGNSFGAYNDTTNEPGPYSLNVSGSSLSLFLPASDPSTNGIHNSSVYVWNCQNLNISGNTINSGGFGVYYPASCSNSVILANNFRGVSFASIEDFGVGSEVSQQVIGNTLSSGFSYHLKANYWEGPNWFLYNNQFVNSNGVTVPAFTDSADLWAHITR